MSAYSASLSKVARHSAVEQVRSQLVELIESGGLKVNDRLPSEVKLARSLGVSRPVIREALVSLRALGLTTSETGKGTFVASDHMRTPLLLGRYLPAHLNEIRCYLEVPAARLAALRRTDEDVARLADIMPKLEHTEDPARRNKLDAQFHISIALATGNSLFVRLIEDLRTILEQQSLAVSMVPGRHARASAEHRAIYEAIVRRDAQAAGDAMAAHLDAVAALATLGTLSPSSSEGQNAAVGKKSTQGA